MFDIYLTNEIAPESNGKAVYGRIQIGDYFETFISSLVCWSPTQYEAHWLNAGRRLVEDASESALITSYVKPSMAEFLIWWPLYREENIVHVRNELLMFDRLSNPFVVDNPWPSIRERKILTDEGFKISEWDTDIQSIREFVDRRSSR